MILVASIPSLPPLLVVNIMGCLLPPTIYSPRGSTGLMILSLPVNYHPTIPDSRTPSSSSSSEVQLHALVVHYLSGVKQSEKSNQLRVPSKCGELVILSDNQRHRSQKGVAWLPRQGRGRDGMLPEVNCTHEYSSRLNWWDDGGIVWRLVHVHCLPACFRSVPMAGRVCGTDWIGNRRVQCLRQDCSTPTSQSPNQ